MAPAASRAATAASSSSSVITGLLGDLAQLFGVSGDGAAGPGTLDAAGLTSWLGLVASGVSANPSAALLPVQVTYYMGMLGSTPARMFMSSGSSAGSGATGTLANMSDSLLGNVGKLVDSKAASVLGGVGGQLQKWGAGIQASLASAHRVGGLSIPQRLARPAAPEMARAAPTLPATSVAAPTMTGGLPGSPFSQGLMGALAGRGVTSLGSRVAAKVMPRSPAGG